MPFSHFVYILRCIKNGSTFYYTGISKQPKKRYTQHRRGQSKYTKRFHGNLYMEYLEEFIHRDEKIVRYISHQRELKIKKFSPKKKIQLIKINRNRSNTLIHRYIG